MLKILKITFLFFIAFVMTGCTVFDSQNKVVHTLSPNFITLQVGYERDGWAQSVAQSHCARNSKILFELPYMDNSWYKEATYFCIDEKERNDVKEIYGKLDYDNFFVYMRSIYGGIPSQIQRVGSVAVPLSNLIVKPQTSAPSTTHPIQPVQMICIKSGESINGMFKTCRYSCGGTPVSNTVRLTEVCEMQKRF
jgi:hypothetical protein